MLRTWYKNNFNGQKGILVPKFGSPSKFGLKRTNFWIDMDVLKKRELAAITNADKFKDLSVFLKWKHQPLVLFCPKRPEKSNESKGNLLLLTGMSILPRPRIVENQSVIWNSFPIWRFSNFRCVEKTSVGAFMPPSSNLLFCPRYG